MHDITVIFSHGRDSGPWGAKIRALVRVAENCGCQVISRDDTDTLDPEERVQRLEREARQLEGRIVLVGSSMGGYVATVASAAIKPIGLFLMAPALGLPGYEVTMPQPVADELSIVHGWDDDLIGDETVIDFARRNRAMLSLVPARHALLEEIDWLARIFDLFLDRCGAKQTEVPAVRLMATF